MTIDQINLSSLVANDDGSSYNKVAYWVYENGKLTIKNEVKPTYINEGIPNIQWSGASSIATVFDVNGHILTCDEDTPGYDVRSRANHQWSEGVVAMNQFILQAAGFSGKEVNLATGIPVEMYFSGKDGGRNDEIVTKKEKAFVEAEIKNKLDSKGAPTEVDQSKLVTVKSNTVIPEAIGAYMDMVVGEDGSVKRKYEENVLVIDMGSYTTDIAVVGPNFKIRKEYTTTLDDQGFLNIYDQFRKLAYQSGITIKQIPNSKVEEAFRTNKLNFATKSINVEEIIFQVKDLCITPIVSEIKRLLGDDIEFLSGIICVGGGAEVIKEHLGELSEVVEIPENPQFANANGMLKTITYYSQSEVVNDLVGENAEEPAIA